MISGVCSGWLAVEIALQDRRRGGLWGVVAIAMAASDRVFLALFTMLDRLG